MIALAKFARRFVGALSAIAIFACFGAQPASAQDKTIHMVVPFPAGGGIDILARILAPKLQAAYGQTTIVENKPGGSGFVGTLTVVKAKPDGLYLLQQAMGMSMNPSIYKNLPYDSIRDLEPVALIGVVPVTLAIGNHVAAKTLPEFIALAKASPGKYKSAAFVNGAAVLMLQLFNQQAGVDINIINYRGTAPALAATVSGETDFVIMPSVISSIKDGKLRGLAVAAAQRMDELPDLPTTVEVGLPDFKIEFWFGTFTTAGTPPDVVARLNSEINKAVALPDVTAKLKSVGIEPRNGTAGQFRDQFHREIREWAEVVKKSGFKPLEN